MIRPEIPEINLPELNLPEYEFRFRTSGQSTEIFDSLRRKYVVLTPEEWVRQNFIMFISNELKYPAGLLAVEKGFLVNSRNKRADIVVYNNLGQPWMIVECKAPTVKLNENSFYQASDYHLKLNVQYLVVTNGFYHYCCKFAGDSFTFINGFPKYNE